MRLKPNFLEDSTILIDLGRCIPIVFFWGLALPESMQKQSQNIKTPVRIVGARFSFLKALKWPYHQKDIFWHDKK